MKKRAKMKPVALKRVRQGKPFWLESVAYEVFSRAGGTTFGKYASDKKRGRWLADDTQVLARIGDFK